MYFPHHTFLSPLPSASQHTPIGDGIVSLAPDGWEQLRLLWGTTIKKLIDFINAQTIQSQIRHLTITCRGFPSCLICTNFIFILQSTNFLHLCM